MQNPLPIGQSMRGRRRGATRRSGRLHIRRDDRSGEGTALLFVPRCGWLARSTHSTLRTWAPQRASKESCCTKAHGGAATKIMACQLTEIISSHEPRSILWPALRPSVSQPVGLGGCHDRGGWLGLGARVALGDWCGSRVGSQPMKRAVAAIEKVFPKATVKLEASLSTHAVAGSRVSRVESEPRSRVEEL